MMEENTTLQDPKILKIPIGFRRQSGRYVKLWSITQLILFQTFQQFIYKWRRFLMMTFGVKIGEGVILRPCMHTQFRWKMILGDSSWIGDDEFVYSLGPIETETTL